MKSEVRSSEQEQRDLSEIARAPVLLTPPLTVLVVAAADTANNFNEASYLQPALRAAPIAMPEIPFPPQQMDFKAKKSSRRKSAKHQVDDDSLGFDFLTTKRERSSCQAELYTDADMERVEAGWKTALSEESAKSSGIFNKIAVGLDGGTLIIPRVELTSKRRQKANLV